MDIVDEMKKHLLRDLPLGSELIIINHRNTVQGSLPWPMKLYKLNPGDTVYKVQNAGDKILVRTAEGKQFKLSFIFFSTKPWEVAKKLLHGSQS